jgi:hypothetical protein
VGSTLESACNKIDLVAGQSSSLSLTAAMINQRPRQLHDVRPHVSLLHTSDPGVGLGRQFGGRLRTRISCLNNSDVDYAPVLLACQAVRLVTTAGPEGTRPQEGGSTRAVGTPFFPVGLTQESITGNRDVFFSVGRWPRESGSCDKGAGGNCGRRPTWVLSIRRVPQLEIAGHRSNGFMPSRRRVDTV